MDRRKFIKFGGLVSAGTAVVGVSKAKETPEEIPHFEEGQILTSKQLNALVDRINELSKRA
jgi:hypothetical protein